MTARKTNSGHRNTANKRKSNTSYRRKRTKKGTDNSMMPIILLAVAVFLFLCNFGVIGSLGDSISDILFGIVGLFAYLLPVLLFADMMYRLLTHGAAAFGSKRLFIYICLILLCIAFDMGGGVSFSLQAYDAGQIYTYSAEHHSGGGILFGSLSYLLNSLLGKAGTILLMLVLGIISLILITEGAILRGIQMGTGRLMDSAREETDRFRERQEEWREDSKVRREEEQKRREALQQQRLEERRERARQREEERKLRREQEEQEQILRRKGKADSGIMQHTLLEKEPSRSHLRGVGKEMTAPEIPLPKTGASEMRRKHKANVGKAETPVGNIHEIVMEKPSPEHLEENIAHGSLKESDPSLDYDRWIDDIAQEPEEEPMVMPLPEPAGASLEAPITGPVVEKITRHITEVPMDTVAPGTGSNDPDIGLSPEKVAKLEAEIAPLPAPKMQMAKPDSEERYYELDQNVPWTDQREDFSGLMEETAPSKDHRVKATTNWKREEESKTESELLLHRLNGSQEFTMPKAKPYYEEGKEPYPFAHEESVPKDPEPALSDMQSEISVPDQVMALDAVMQADADEAADPFDMADAFDGSMDTEEMEEDSIEDSIEDFIEDFIEDPIEDRVPGSEIAAAKQGILKEPAGGSPVSKPAPPASGNQPMQRRIPFKPKEYLFPKLEFLKKGNGGHGGDDEDSLRESAHDLRDTLETFGVKATITDISQGPAVTRFELQPEPGVKVSKIVGLADDIKLNLAATDVRIEAPIPGKRAVGIEVPNKEISSVALRDLLESPEFRRFPSRLAFAVGKDIAGKTVVHDIAKMPHVLIAGATGSGKSVCINTLIMSILYKAKPEDVKLIMIDPKVVELSVYNGIPHLMIPVVTDPKKATAALQWAVAEMDDRYRRFAEFHVRDLKSYNSKVEERIAQDPALKKMPQIVVIVDELADLMMVASSDVEASICRLAQLARAAGIHLIIATQRPSVDVITGLIKANMPSRIAFAVTSNVDSRTILDMTGAEKLLGKGDMLFYPTGYPKPIRVQGAFISDDEIGTVVNFLKNQEIGNIYESDIEEKIAKLGSSSNGEGDGGSEEFDELFEKAARLIIEKDKASIGYLQRVLKIGFNRAARIMDQLSEADVVGPEEGTKPRKVRMSMEQFDQYIEEVL